LLSRLSADRALEFADHAVIICSVDPDGHPHPAMVSSVEMIAVDAGTIRFAIYGSSRTARYLRENGRITIIVADEAGVFYVKGTVSAAATPLNIAPELTIFTVHVGMVLEDHAAKHEDARIVSGITVRRGAMDVARARAILASLMSQT
jgi:hypothetical protein